MTPLKTAILEEVRKNHTKSEAFTDAQLHELIFHHRDGLRLSYAGFIILKNLFDIYSFEIPVTMKTKHHAALANLEFPYFFTKRRLILFSELDAMTVKLSGGIEQFLENCYQIDKF